MTIFRFQLHFRQSNLVSCLGWDYLVAFTCYVRLSGIFQNRSNISLRKPSFQPSITNSGYSYWWLLLGSRYHSYSIVNIFAVNSIFIVCSSHCFYCFGCSFWKFWVLPLYLIFHLDDAVSNSWYVRCVSKCKIRVAL